MSAVEICQCLADAQQQIQSAQVGDSPRIDAEAILAWVLQRERTYFYTWPEKTLTQAQTGQFQQALLRRLKGEPVAYIVGEREFWSMPFFTEPSTLIPRADTEILVEACLDLNLDKQIHVLDLGTGTGAIAIALASEMPGWKVEGVDVNVQAVALAVRNGERNDINNVRFYQSDWYQQVSQRYQLIVSNPPYIAPDDEHLGCGDLLHEPERALVAQADGLADIAAIIDGAKTRLKGNGWLALEHGWRQAVDVQRIFDEHGFIHINTVKDYGGNDRATLAQLLV
ncbi:MAG: protein-(glutamine-N5) methyltransferase, release factor-specific [Alteromonadaceae bacterium]|nr:MAG: protein-(glutamine-N5) methyltransferase, release factor-specific [Alteromonadaceae bacterium]